MRAGLPVQNLHLFPACLHLLGAVAAGWRVGCNSVQIWPGSTTAARLAALAEGASRAASAEQTKQVTVGQCSSVMLAEVTLQRDPYTLLQHLHPDTCVHCCIWTPGTVVPAVSCYPLISMSPPDQPAECRAAAVKAERGEGGGLQRSWR